MKEFKDDQGRPWMVALTVAAADRVRGLVTIDVTDDVEQADGRIERQRRTEPFDMIDAGNISRTLEVLRSQYGKIGEILYAICRKQADEKKLTKEDFLEGLKGDALEAGVKALEAELVDFFPPRLRRMVGLLVAKMDEMATELTTRAEAGLAAATVESLTGASGTQSMRPPESSASTPARGPSDSSSPLETAA
jgi:hypothetical protein